MHNKIIVGLLQVSSEHLITAHLQIYHITDPYIDHTEEPLVLLLELLLVKDLDGKDAIFIYSPVLQC